ncbi:unnamed protein product, partial [Owenia fusiformis]
MSPHLGSTPSPGSRSRPDSGVGSSPINKPTIKDCTTDKKEQNNIEADPGKKKEHEEKVRKAREEQAQERARKLRELREAQKAAMEFRDKQQTERRKKIEEMKRRDDSRRQAVEERRRKVEKE